MKFWWRTNEALIATLLAWTLTGEPRFAERHCLVHDWSFAHFPDPEYGEWYGYLHRDGRVSVRLKGNLWKGPFHLPRMCGTAGACWPRSAQLRAASRSVDQPGPGGGAEGRGNLGARPPHHVRPGRDRVARL